MYGALLAVATQLEWDSLQPPGTIIGPESFIQTLVLRIGQGILLCALGCVLALGGWLLYRHDRSAEPVPGRASPPRWRSLILALAVLLVLTVFVVGLFPAPLHTLTLPPSDFAVAPPAADSPGLVVLVSRPFTANVSDYFYSFASTTYRNLSGAVVFTQNMTYSYVKGVSDPYGPRQFGGGNVAPSTGPYLVVVETVNCEYFALPPCTNYTIDATAIVWVSSPTIYLPLQYGLGIAACAVVTGTVVQAGLGSRRTTSW